MAAARRLRLEAQSPMQCIWSVTLLHFDAVESQFIGVCIMFTSQSRWTMLSELYP